MNKTRVIKAYLKRKAYEWHKKPTAFGEAQETKALVDNRTTLKSWVEDGPIRDGEAQTHIENNRPAWTAAVKRVMAKSKAKDGSKT